MKCKHCGAEITEKQEWLKIPELGLEIETKLHDKGKVLKDIKIPRGCRLAKTYEMMHIFHFKKYADKLIKANGGEFWSYAENVEWLKKKYVVVFWAVSDWACLYCDWSPSISSSSLGVVFVREC